MIRLRVIDPSEEGQVTPYFNVGATHTCPVCKKEFFVGTTQVGWAYRIRRGNSKKLVCSYSCMRRGKSD